MLSCQRALFSLPDDLHYLNCAYMAPVSKRVAEAGLEGIRRTRVPTAITPEVIFGESDELRRRFARLINAPSPRRVAVIPSVSYGMATVARNLSVRPGQNLVIAHEQFPSNVYVWRRASRAEGLTLRVVAPPEDGVNRGREWNTRLLDAIDRDTALVALSHVHWTDGTRFDLAAIGRRARECGAAFVVDGTQSVGAMPFDVQALEPDALVCAGYKWLMGPYSIGLAYYGPRFDGGVPLEEHWLARLGSEDFRNLVQYRDEYQPGALRYDVGERSNFILGPMLQAALDQILEWGATDIQAYCRQLTAPLIAELGRRDFTIEDEAWHGAHLFGLRLPAHLDVGRVGATLAAHRVIVSLRGSALRISPHVYNDEHDIAALLEALIGP